MPKRPFRVALIIVASTVAVLLVVGGIFLYKALHYADGRNSGKPEMLEIEIKPGMSFPAVASLLSKRGVIDKPTWFRMYAMWRGDTTNIKQGKYQMNGRMTPREVLDALVAGVKDVTVEVALPPGENMLEYFARLECPRAKPEDPCGPAVASAAELTAAARDPEFLRAHAITGDSVEGYLYPDTYQFRVGDDPRKVLEKLVGRFQKKWNELVQANPKDVAKIKDRLHWTDRDILVMASIVEKEAVEPKEQPTIAQVFMNRLTSDSFKPKRFETDPTIRYGCVVDDHKSAACEEWLKTCTTDVPPKCPRLRRAQLDDTDNRYNTYTHEGLPPGPIANPGIGAVKAVLQPDGSPWFYFVAKNEHEHAFAKTLAEHQKNVDLYQK